MLPMLRNRFAMPLMSSDPWSDFRREMDRVFDSVLAGRAPESAMAWLPPVDVEESKDTLRFSVEVPGVNPEDLNVTVENGLLTVSGEKRYEHREGEEDQGGRFVERRYGRFERSLMLPEYADAENVSAQYDRGVLTIEIPKTESAKPRRIEIGRRDEQQQISAGTQGRSQRSENRERERQNV